MIESDALRELLAQKMSRAVTVLGIEPILGGWNSAMLRAVVDRGDGPESVVLRSDLPTAEAVVHTDLADEWRILRVLNELDAPIAPRALCEDLDGQYLGRPTIVTEFLDGVSTQAHLMAEGTDPDKTLEEFAALTTRIHAVPVDRVPGSMAAPRDWDSYIDGRLEAWVTTERAWIERDPVMRYIATWLDAHRPPPVDLTLVHGDFHVSNTMTTAGGGQLAVDWEFARIGDPREDLGWSLTYEPVANLQFVTTRQERFCQLYREATGMTEDQLNPAVLAWFSLLNVETIVSSMLPSCHALVGGANTSLVTAMGLTLGLIDAPRCLVLISRLEAVA